MTRRSVTYALLTLSLFLGGCLPDQKFSALVERPVSFRPIVGINAVVDHARHGLPWDISQELTQAIRLRLTQQNRLYLLSEPQVTAMAQKLTEEQDPFSENISWLKKAYPQNEFVTFCELLEHRETPLSKNEGSPAELTIAMKIHVFDLRGDHPRPVLQEIVQQLHHIPAPFAKSPSLWGDEIFEISPLGLAHDKLCQEVANRIQDYILINCEKL